jgi:hypothetical protein
MCGYWNAMVESLSLHLKLVCVLILLLIAVYVRIRNHILLLDLEIAEHSSRKLGELHRTTN